MESVHWMSEGGWAPCASGQSDPLTQTQLLQLKQASQGQHLQHSLKRHCETSDMDGGDKKT